jgi:phosphatidylglycerol---prolipoprotein diacylglyceryl transferase
MDFPAFDPVALHLGPLVIRWYALAYLVGFLGGWWYGVRLVSLSGARPNKADIDDFIAWAIVGVILGGRFGYVLFYNFAQYADDPLAVFKVWEGGMSFHGGVAGIIIALLIFSHYRKFSPRRLADVICTVAPIGLFFGRCANFVNGELYGRVTDVPWAVKFPAGGYEPRHPSQLYEAGLEGLVLLVLLGVLARREQIRETPGILTGVFLIGYGLSRIFVEFFREPDAQLGFIFAHVSMGQILSVPMIVLGACVISYAINHRKAS